MYRRQIERSKLAREKQLREAAERDKSILEQKLLEFQEEIRLAKEALVRYLLQLGYAIIELNEP